MKIKLLSPSLSQKLILFFKKLNKIGFKKYTLIPKKGFYTIQKIISFFLF
jgi:hypothetical protein